MVFERGYNIAYLKEHKVSIWDEWADEQGNLGPVRQNNGAVGKGANGAEVDQITDLYSPDQKPPTVAD